MTIIGAGMSHAPQLYLRPTKEADDVDAFRVAMAAMAERYQAMDLDAVVLVGNDHLHNCFLDLVPSFLLVASERVEANFAGGDIDEPGAPEIAEPMLDHVVNSGFDLAMSQGMPLDHSIFIPLHFLRGGGLTAPVIPLLVNCYMPPQPSIQRCYDLGRSIGQFADHSGLRVGVLGTGGLSHYPGTPHYPNPDREADAQVLAAIEAGDVSELLTWDAKTLDKKGMVELRAWAIALGSRHGALDPKPPHYVPNWHCGFAAVEF